MSLRQTQILLSKPDLLICFDLLHTFLKSEFSAVQAQIIVSRIRPLMACMIAVKISSVCIGLLNKLLHFFLCHAVPFHSSVQAKLFVCMDEYTHYIRIILQHIISTSSNNDTGFFCSQILDYLCLIVKQIII